MLRDKARCMRPVSKITKGSRLLQVVGAAAMLGGVTRMTISITVLVMEGAGALQLTGPLMVAVFVAKMVGDALTPSIYDVHIKIRGAPVLVSAPAWPFGSSSGRCRRTGHSMQQRHIEPDFWTVHLPRTQ